MIKDDAAKLQRRRTNGIIREHLKAGFPVEIISEKETIVITDIKQIVITSAFENLYLVKGSNFEKVDHTKVAFVMGQQVNKKNNEEIL